MSVCHYCGGQAVTHSCAEPVDVYERMWVPLCAGCALSNPHVLCAGCLDTALMEVMEGHRISALWVVAR